MCCDDLGDANNLDIYHTRRNQTFQKKYKTLVLRHPWKARTLSRCVKRGGHVD